ncbi:MAG: pilus assembly protein TadG-related protein, partial [Steroidobacteraceae bacterium]
MPRRQQGQSLVVLVVLLAALLGALWWTVEAGSAVNEKQRLANAADAAALSAAVWQARALNFDAYTNRAIVANEAAFAQSVSLRSWSSYMTRLLPGAALVTAWVPYLNSAMMTLQRIWHHIDAVVQPSLMLLETTTSLVNHDIAAAQRV